MSLVLRGFKNNTVATRGFTAQSIRDQIIAIFLKSPLYPIINAISRMC